MSESLWGANKVDTDLAHYRHYWRSVPKWGKTTLFYEVVKELYGSLDCGLLISCGNERGYKALDGIVVANCPTFDNLTEVVDELTDNPEGNNFKLIALDTVDQLVEMAKNKVIRLDYKKTGTRHEFNACLGGYGAGRRKVEELIGGVLAKLEAAGYGLIYIGHSKIKDVKEKDGVEYQQLTSNLNSDYDAIFANAADVIMMGVMSKEVNSDGQLESINRYMYFRGDNFIDAGGRFKVMPNHVELSAKNYIQAVQEGIEASLNGGTVKDGKPSKKTKAAPVEDDDYDELPDEPKPKKTRAKKAKPEPKPEPEPEVEEEEPNFVEEENNMEFPEDWADEDETSAEELKKMIKQAIGKLGPDARKAKQAQIKEAGLPVQYARIEDSEVLNKYLGIING